MNAGPISAGPRNGCPGSFLLKRRDISLKPGNLPTEPLRRQETY